MGCRPIGCLSDKQAIVGTGHLASSLKGNGTVLEGSPKCGIVVRPLITSLPAYSRLMIAGRPFDGTITIIDQLVDPPNGPSVPLGDLVVLSERN